MTLVAAQTTAPPGPPLTLAALFGEDFDHRARPAPPAPAIVEPVYSAADLEQATEQAREAGYSAGTRDASQAAAQSRETATGLALTSIADALTRSRQDALDLAERSARKLASALTEMLAAALPMLCARHGAAEVAAVLREMLPYLADEPLVTVQVHPALVPMIQQALLGTGLGVAERVEIIAADALGPSDVRIAWRHGTTTRDQAALFARIADILVPEELLAPSGPAASAAPRDRNDPDPGDPAQPPSGHMIRETHDVE